MYKVLLTPDAAEFLKTLPDKIQCQIADKIDMLSNNPYLPKSLKLKGTNSLYRFRSGDYRIIYEIADDILIITIIRIGHRKDIYKKLFK